MINLTLDRNWIGIDIGNEAIKVMLNRFRNGTQTLDKHIGIKKETPKQPDLFCENTIRDNICGDGKIICPLIDDYTVYANENYSGTEFEVISDYTSSVLKL